MNKILITGASGFIGGNLLQYYVDNNYIVLNLDNDRPKKQEHLQFWKKIDINEYEWTKIIILDFQPDYIVHLAARTDLGGKTLEDYKTNIFGVNNIMNIARELPSLKKIIIASSMLVCHGGYYPKNQFDYKPSTVYGKSKVETEKMVWANKPFCDWAIIRPTSIWGPGFGIPYKNFFDMIISKKYFHIGNMGCTKTYGYVGNAIYQIDKLLFTETRDELNKVFFIGDYLATNIEDWGDEIASELGYKIIKVPYYLVKLAAIFGDILKMKSIDFPMTSFRLKNMITDNVLDLSNINEIAGELPFTRKEGIRNTLDWLKNNK